MARNTHEKVEPRARGLAGRAHRVLQLSAAATIRVRARLRKLSTPVAVKTWLRACSPTDAQHLFGLTLLVGVVCGLVAVAFHLAIQGAERLLMERALRAPGAGWRVWTIVTPTLGGLFAGACLTWIVPGARGSGVPQVKAAYATEGGRVRFRDAVGKFIVGALQIGSGASLGREGPTVQICAGATSLLARLTALPPRSMRRLTPVGVAAGIAAAFNAPIAAVTFTIEEIVGTLDNTVLSGVVVAAALAAVIERGVLGVHPVIQVKESYGLEHASSLATYALLGIAAAVVSVIFTDGLLKLRLWFRGFTALPKWAHPAVGGLVTGCLAVLMLYLFNLTGVTGGGYETLSRALAGELGIRALVVLCVAKLIATVFSYSSGGAGGIFAPALFVGAMLGGTFGYGDVLLFSHEHAQLGAFALVGMGAVFAGVVRAPITSVLIIFEMTGSYGLVLPLMLANMTAYMLARRWRSTPIYDALLEQDGIELPHPNVRVHPLEQLTVAHAMTTQVCSLQVHASLRDAAAKLRDQTFTIAPVVDALGVALGCVSVYELRRAAVTEPESSVEKLMTPVCSIHPDAPLVHAIVRMTDLGVRQLCVLQRGVDELVVGVVAMSDVVRAHARAVSGSAARAHSSSAPPLSPNVQARDIMREAVLVSEATPLPELEKQLPGGRGFIVYGLANGTTEHSADSYRAVLPEDLGAFARDEDFESVLRAGDVAQAAPAVPAAASLQELAYALHSAQANAAVVYEGPRHALLGIVTRAALADALLEWFTATRASSGPLSAPAAPRLPS